MTGTQTDPIVFGRHRVQGIASLVLVLTLALCPLRHAVAQSESSTVGASATGVQQAAPIGYEFRADVVAAVNLLQAGKLLEAREVLPKVCERIEAQFRPGQRYVVVDNGSQLASIQRSSSTEVKAIDISYALCLQAQLFLLVEQKDLGSAQGFIEKIEVYVPTMAAPHVEVGFVLSALGRYEESVLAYERAQSIAVAYPPQSNALAKALRGIGANRIDQGRLDDAELYYRKSLELEPHSQLAQHQLEYIKARRQR